MKNKLLTNEEIKNKIEKMNYVKRMHNTLMKLDNKQLIGVNKIISGDIEGIKEIFNKNELEEFIEQEKDFLIEEKIEDYKNELIKYIRGF